MGTPGTRAADVVTVVSEQQARLVRARFGADRVRVVHNSIDTDRWRKLAADAPQAIDPTDILFVGSLLPAKGIFVLLRAAKLLRKTGWRGRLVLAGRTTPQFERFVRLRACPRHEDCPIGLCISAFASGNAWLAFTGTLASAVFRP